LALQITYILPFRLTTEQLSQNLRTAERTFIPRTCITPPKGFSLELATLKSLWAILDIPFWVCKHEGPQTWAVRAGRAVTRALDDAVKMVRVLASGCEERALEVDGILNIFSMVEF
jgi:hypothetical protein